MAAARSCGPPGWTPPEEYSTIVNEADEPFFVRYVPDEGGPTFVYVVPAGAFAKGLTESGWSGTVEVLNPDCAVVGSMPVHLLMGSMSNETIIGSDGKPRQSDVHPDYRRAPDDELEPITGTCR
jgi:hypothetical protein